jgi:hypothetical protein
MDFHSEQLSCRVWQSLTQLIVIGASGCIDSTIHNCHGQYVGGFFRVGGLNAVRMFRTQRDHNRINLFDIFLLLDGISKLASYQFRRSYSVTVACSVAPPTA